MMDMNSRGLELDYFKRIISKVKYGSYYGGNMELGQKRFHGFKKSPLLAPTGNKDYCFISYKMNLLMEMMFNR
jgi:hypothetical protein